MHDTVIFCWSGTGNCLDMAKNIAGSLGGADIISLRKMPSDTDFRAAKRVCFVFPAMAAARRRTSWSTRRCFTSIKTAISSP